eukprot:TRINITY_DN23_c0_g2_i1.p1 TRINITY_DN23_c0_g2~~TRINITY_DN23_c0_g2_i1.p1  ORF type:complete len:563 (+),score=68.58 TRINITY_DN23_c0_g2_i1:454-2142(+)
MHAFVTSSTPLRSLSFFSRPRYSEVCSSPPARRYFITATCSVKSESITALGTEPVADISIGWKPVAPISDEVSLPVSGQLPKYLGEATLYRIGPGTFEATHKDGIPYKLTHWFDGLSLIHAFRIEAQTNKVWYRNRFLSDSKLRCIQGTPSSTYKDITFGVKDPCRSLWGKFFQLFQPDSIDPTSGKAPPRNVNVCFNYIPGKGIVIRTDLQQSMKLDEQALKADHFFQLQDIHRSLKGFVAGAHGHYDSCKGEFINFTYWFGGPRVEYHVFKIGESGKPQTMCKFWDIPRYVHSFATTENYVVMGLYPLTILWWKVYFHQSVMAGLHFDNHLKAKFVVISRVENKIVATYESEPMFAFHTINAYETEDGIVIDLSHYKDASIVHNFNVRTLCEGSEIAKNSLVRVELENLSAAKRSGPGKTWVAQVRLLNDFMLELPCINSTKERKRHRYVYGVSTSENSNQFGTISKVDVETGKRLTRGFRYGMVSEPVFVADPDGSEEDDGCILVVVLDVAERRSNMFVLDAKDLTQIAQARVPQVVPQGFHGMFRRPQPAAVEMGSRG